MTIAHPGLTNPEAGVTAPRPATIPEANPRALGFFRISHSMAIQEHDPAAAAVIVAVKARAAVEFAARALPALKPNQPNQRSPTPSSVIVRLWGTNISPGNPLRFPITMAMASAETPAERCTTRPPAKSRPPIDWNQ